jgi:hypothetical protein
MSIKQNIPMHLWDGLKELCFRQDMMFLHDVSRITGIPFQELRKKITGTRGIPTMIPIENNPWWTTDVCPIMNRIGYLWRRCSMPCTSNGYCFEHFQSGDRMKKYDDPIFQTMSTSISFNYNNTIYWVNVDDGSVLNSFGLPVKEFTIDIVSKTVHWV